MLASKLLRHIVFIAGIFLGAFPAKAEWDQHFGRVAGVNQFVYRIYPTTSNVFVGGQFTASGATSADQIAMWDGSDWRSYAPLPEPRFWGHVSNVLVDSNGAPVVVFRPNTSADYPTFHVWQWSGSSWSSLSGMERGEPRAALFWNNRLALFGSFSEMPFTTEGLAQWDGTNWIRGGLTNFGVSSALEFNGEIYVAGRSMRSAAALQRFGKWTGQKWQELGPYLGVNLGPIDLVATAGALYSGGYFHQQGRYEVARWNGSSWDVLFPRDTNALAPLHFSASSPIAATDSAVYYACVVESGDESSAEIIDVTDPDQKSVASDRIPPGALRIYTLAGRGGRLYVGGLFNKIGDVAASQIAMREQGAWHRLSAEPSFGLAGDPSCVIPFGSGFVVGGNIWNAGDVPINYVARWNGSTWDDMGGGVGGVVTSLAVHDSNLYASTYPADQLSANFTLWRWTGDLWTNIATADWGITKLVSLQSNLMVLGKFTTIGGVNATNIAEFDGTTFKPFLETIPAGDWQDIQQIGDAIYVAGVSNIVRWNGSRWDFIATVECGLYGGAPTVYALGQMENNLLAAGEFAAINGVTADKIAVWNGNAWTPLAGGATEFSTLIRSLAVQNGDVYVAGSFPKISGVAAENVALLREGNWTDVGGGLGGVTELGGVWGVAADQHSVVFAGSFTIAGATPSVGIARWVPNAIMPAISSVRMENSKISIEFSGQPNAVTVLERASTLSSISWAEIFRTFETNSVKFQIDVGESAGFFRLRVD